MRSHYTFLFCLGAVWALFGQSPPIIYEWVSPGDVGLEQFAAPAPESDPRPAFGQNIDYTAFLPDTLHRKSQPLRRVRLAYHFMNTADTFYTEYEGAEGVEFARAMTYYMNTHLDSNKPYSLDPELPVYDPTWRFTLGRKPGTESYAVFHHYSDSAYDYLHAGPDVNRSRRNVNQYTEGLDSLLHIFIMAPPRDSMRSSTFTPEGPLGLWNGRAIKVTGYYPRLDPWRYRRNLNHEAGHALGLPHAWLRSDGCDDTVSHPNNCWDHDENPGCDSMASNNMMDYNVWQLTLTPCQIGRVNALLSRRGSAQRSWVSPNWCRYNQGFSVRVTESVAWRGARDLQGDLTVAPGVRLRIDGRVHLPPGARLRVEPGATLVLGPNALLHNDCGQRWLGIELGRNDLERAQLLTEPGFRIQNVATN